MTLAGSGKQGSPRVPQQKDLRTRRALNRQAGNGALGGGGISVTTGQLFSQLPAPGNEGDVFLPSDARLLLVDNGTYWVPFGLVFPLTQPGQTKLPTATDFAWLNQGTATVQNSQGYMALQDFGPGANTHTLRAQIQTLTLVPPYNIVCLFAVNIPTDPSAAILPSGGIIAYDSANDKAVTWGVQWRGTGAVVVAGGAGGVTPGLTLTASYWSSHTVLASDLATPPMPPISVPSWLTIRNDGTNRDYGYSTDGNNFTRVYREAFNANGVVIDKIGMYINTHGAPTSFQVTGSFYSFYTV